MTPERDWRQEPVATLVARNFAIGSALIATPLAAAAFIWPMFIWPMPVFQRTLTLAALMLSIYGIAAGSRHPSFRVRAFVILANIALFVAIIRAAYLTFRPH